MGYLAFEGEQWQGMTRPTARRFFNPTRVLYSRKKGKRILAGAEGEGIRGARRRPGVQSVKTRMALAWVGVS